MDKVMELFGGGSVINGAYPVLFLKASQNIFSHILFIFTRMGGWPEFFFFFSSIPLKRVFSSSELFLTIYNCVMQKNHVSHVFAGPMSSGAALIVKPCVTNISANV